MHETTSSGVIPLAISPGFAARARRSRRRARKSSSTRARGFSHRRVRGSEKGPRKSSEYTRSIICSLPRTEPRQEEFASHLSGGRRIGLDLSPTKDFAGNEVRILQKNSGAGWLWPFASVVELHIAARFTHGITRNDRKRRDCWITWSWLRIAGCIRRRHTRSKVDAMIKESSVYVLKSGNRITDHAQSVMACRHRFGTQGFQRLGNRRLWWLDEIREAGRTSRRKPRAASSPLIESKIKYHLSEMTVQVDQAVARYGVSSTATPANNPSEINPKTAVLGSGTEWSWMAPRSPSL